MFISAEAATGWRVGVVLPGETDVRDLVIPGDGGSAWVPATDGVDLVWEQTYRGGSAAYERVELWTSPYATEPSDLVPRIVTEYPVPNPGSHGVGFRRAWAFEQRPSARSAIAIYSLGSGERRFWELPPERGFRGAIVGPEEIGFFVGYVDGVQGLETLRFYRYEALPVAPSP